KEYGQVGMRYYTQREPGNAYEATVNEPTTISALHYAAWEAFAIKDVPVPENAKPAEEKGHSSTPSSSDAGSTFTLIGARFRNWSDNSDRVAWLTLEMSYGEWAKSPYLDWSVLDQSVREDYLLQAVSKAYGKEGVSRLLRQYAENKASKVKN